MAQKILEKHTVCEACDGTGVCPKCLNTGGYLNENTGTYEDCTLCDWESIGVCWKCKGLKGEITYEKSEKEPNIQLDFSKEIDEHDLEI